MVTVSNDFNNGTRIVVYNRAIGLFHDGRPFPNFFN